MPMKIGDRVTVYRKGNAKTFGTCWIRYMDALVGCSGEIVNIRNKVIEVQLTKDKQNKGYTWSFPKSCLKYENRNKK